MSTAKVRGVESCGMLCSAYDLGWSSAADGAAVELPGSAVAGDACPEQPPSKVPLPGAVLACTPVLPGSACLMARVVLTLKNKVVCFLRG